MAEKKETQQTATCGIVMPISAMGEAYPAEHWRRVRKIIERAIQKAGLRSILVWENAEVDVIQSAILQNLYENDVVVCDVSGLNPNVMLEAGLRLSTKKPTIIITDRIQKPPFDISNIGYLDYQKDLEYNAIEDFIEKLSNKIRDVNDAHSKGTYKSFVEQFKFETVSPETISVSADEFLREQITDLAVAVRRIERRQTRDERDSQPSRRTPTLMISAKMTPEQARQCELEIDGTDGFGLCAVGMSENGEFEFRVPITNLLMPRTVAREKLQQIIDNILDPIPF